ncbi:hypothetical protein SLEP1_g50369 [Rubroshorea leprosula]|uniref:Uncharacterized protein n=1 Tax=Rubroshorea leprosula TaxID=152421 RepID=A0AAV5LZT1_9ROSI|nr:hypothetical protein SLEP1_g50369 [Rubroshorea leprosula]
MAWVPSNPPRRWVRKEPNPARLPRLGSKEPMCWVPLNPCLGSKEPMCWVPSNPRLGSSNPTGTQQRTSWVPWNPTSGLTEPRRWVRRNPGIGFEGTQALGSKEPRHWVRRNPGIGFEGTQALGSLEPTPDYALLLLLPVAATRKKKKKGNPTPAFEKPNPDLLCSALSGCYSCRLWVQIPLNFRPVSFPALPAGLPLAAIRSEIEDGKTTGSDELEG